MNRILFAVLAALCCAAFARAERPRIVVERPVAAPDTTMAPSTEHRFVLDPAAMAYQMQVDSINQATEDKIRDLIVRLEHKFNDPAVEEEVGKLIGDAVMEQQMALLDLQVDRAISSRDTLLLKGVELALRELIANSSVVRTELMRSLNRLEAAMKQP